MLLELVWFLCYCGGGLCYTDTGVVFCGCHYQWFSDLFLAVDYLFALLE